MNICAMVNETFRLDEGWIILLWIYIFFGLFLKKTQMGLNKKKKIKNSQYPPPPGFFDDPEQMPDAQKMHRRRV